MFKSKYWSTLKNETITNKYIFFFVVLVAVCCFGFTITNSSVGIDDPMGEYYMTFSNRGSMLQQGRLLHILIYFLTDMITFIPFLNDFIAVCLFTLSAFSFVSLFQYVTESRISTAGATAFACVYISYSSICEKFIYQLDVIPLMLSYCCGAWALAYAFRFVEKKEKAAAFLSGALLMLSIGSYETFIGLYICGVFAILLLQLTLCNRKLSFKQFILDGCKYAAILLTSILLYYALVLGIQLVLGQFGVFSRSIGWEPSRGIWENLKIIIYDIAIHLLINKRGYLYLTVFTVTAFLSLVMTAIISIRKKTALVLFCSIGMLAGCLLNHFAVGYLMLRATQPFHLFVGITVLLLIEMFSGKKWLHTAAVGLAVVLIMFQTVDMNQWFYNDYVRYQKESYVVHSIASRLQAECDVSKPVVFVNPPANAEYLSNTESGRQVNGASMLYWGINAFSKEAMYHVFEMYGYHFIDIPTDEQIKEAQREAPNMEAWPHRDSVKETDNIIIVSFSKQEDLQS